MSHGRLLWIAGKGLGAGRNPNGPSPLRDSDNDLLRHPGTAVLSAGRTGILRFPSDRQIRLWTPAATHQLIPFNVEAAPPGTPLRARGPIKHVFYIVRENRTYDQVLGDDPRGDGDRELTLFGARITPNVHALVRRFPLLDHVYADSEASIDGHFWTSAGSVSDYVHKNWQPNYAGRGRPYDFGVFSITWPGRGFLFDRAQRQRISYFNFGEAVAGTVPILAALDKDNTPAQQAEMNAKFRHSDLGAAALGFSGQCRVTPPSALTRWTRSGRAGPEAGDVRLLAAARRLRDRGVEILLLLREVPLVVGLGDGAVVRVHDARRRPQQRPNPRREVTARDGGRERLRPRPGRRRRLAFGDLALLGHLRPRG